MGLRARATGRLDRSRRAAPQAVRSPRQASLALRLGATLAIAGLEAGRDARRSHGALGSAPSAGGTA